VKNCDVIATDPNLAFVKELSLVLNLTDGKQLQLAFETQEAYDEWLNYFKSFSDDFRLVKPEPPPVVVEEPKAAEIPASSSSTTDEKKAARLSRGSVRFSDEIRKLSQTSATMQAALPTVQLPPPETRKEPAAQPASETKAEEIKQPLPVITTKPALPELHVRRETLRPMSEDAYEESPLASTSARDVSVGFFSSSLSQHNEVVLKEVDEITLEEENPMIRKAKEAPMKKLFESVDDSESKPRRRKSSIVTTESPVPKLDVTEKPSFNAHVSPRFYSSSPFEQSQDQVTELNKASFSTGSSLMQSRAAHDPYTEYTEEHESPAKPAQPLKLDKPPSRRPSSQASPRDAATPSDPRRLERRPSLDKSAMQLLNGETTPLGDKRTPLERRPSLSEKLFGFEISPSSKKIEEAVKEKRSSILDTSPPEKPPSRPGTGSEMAKALVPQLKERMVPNQDEDVAPRIVSRVQTAAMEEELTVDERRKKLDIGTGTGIRQVQGETWSGVESVEVEETFDDSSDPDSTATGKRLPGRLNIQQPKSQTENYTQSYATGRVFKPVAPSESEPPGPLKKVPSMYKSAFHATDDTGESEPSAHAVSSNDRPKSAIAHPGSVTASNNVPDDAPPGHTESNEGK
jgi:hypothetical protein